MPKLVRKDKENLVDISKQLSESLKVTVPSEDYLKAVMWPSDYFENFRKQIISACNTTSIMSKMISNFAEMNKSFYENFQNFAKTITDGISFINDFAQKFRELREEEKTVLIETGWVVCPSLGGMPMSDLRRAVINYQRGDRGRQLAILMKNYYGESTDWKRLEEAVARWNQSKLFTKQRMKIINDALEAHKDKKYTLSIPALLPQIEGVISDFCKKKIKDTKPRGKVWGKAKKTIEKLGLQGEEYEAEVISNFVEKQLYIHTEKLKENTKNRKNLNRHGILHGYFPGYPDCTRSLKCFMVLDVLSMLKV